MSLIAWYPFNGNTDDYSGNNHILTVQGTNTLIDAGKIGQTYTMTSGYYKTDINVIPQNLSIGMWFKHNGTNWLSECLFGTRTGSNGFMLYRNDGDTDGYYRIYFWYVNTSAAIVGYYVWPGLSSFAADTWYHIFMTRYADGNLRFFRNGIQIYSQVPPVDFVSWHDNSQYLTFHGQGNGSSYTAGNYNFNDIRVYDNIVSDKEIKEIAKAKILHYNFNDFQEPTTNILNYNSVWAEWGSASSNMATLTLKTGSHSFTTIGTSSVPGAYVYVYPSYYTETELHTLSATFINNSSVTTNVSFRLRGYGNDSSTVDNGSPTYGILAGETRRISFVGTTVTVNGGYTTAIYVYSEGSTGEVNMNVTDVQFEQKTHATPFTPTSRTGTVHDNTGYGNDAVLTESTTPEWIESTAIGSGAYDFGIIQADGYSIQCDTFNNPSDQITINIWLHSKDVGNYSRGFASKADNYLGANGWAWRTGWGDDVRFNIGGNTEVSAYAGVDNNLCMITGTYNSTTGVQKWYKNAVIAQTRNLTPALIGNSSNPLFVGFSTGTGFFKGDMEDFKIYATALSQDDITELYQTRAQLDNVGNLFLNEITINGFKPTILDYTSWVIGSSGSQTGFGQNGSTAENSIITKLNPINENDVIWASLSNDVSSGPDGGWNTTSFPIDNTKAYRFTTWIRRENAGAGDGTTYFGCHGYGSVNGVALIGGSPNTNPYFKTDGNGLTYDSEWTLWIAYIMPYGTATEPTYITDTKGIWNADGTRLTGSMSSFVWLAETTSGNQRTYLYYSTKTDERMYWYRPRVEVIDGNEAPVSILVNCSEHRPLINEAEEYDYNDKNISNTGIGKFTNLTEVGVTDGLVSYWKLNGDAKDYSGNGNDGVVTGAVVTSGLKNLAYEFNGSTSVIYTPTIHLIGTDSFTFNIWAYFYDGAARDIIFGNYNSNPSINIEKTTSNQLRLYWGGSPDLYSTSSVIPNNEWCMVTVLRDKSNSKVKMFINNSNVYDQTQALTDRILVSTYFNIGRDVRTDTTAWNGKATDARIYNRALSEEEINILYKYGLPTTGMQIGSNGTLYINKEIIEGL